MSKELKVQNAQQGSLKVVYFEGGGQLPAGLQGMYTCVTEAQKAIDLHLEEKANAPKSSKRGNKEL